MIKKIIIFIILLQAANIATAQESDTILLQEVQIKSGRIIDNNNLHRVEVINFEDFSMAYDNDVSSLLKISSHVDVRQRSFSNVQTDVSIRGGSFDQNIILLNGINFSNSQTGHHNLNLPVGNKDLHSTEIYYGAASRKLGANAFSGAVNFITKVPENNFVSFSLSGGSFNTYNSSVAAGLVRENSTHYISANYSLSDGFQHNTDYNSLSLYYENNLKTNSLNAKTMLGMTEKSFGAFNFYSPQFPDQYENIQTYLAAIKINRPGQININYNLYWHNLADRFELFREHPDFYRQSNGHWIDTRTQDTIGWYNGHNYHRTNTGGSSINAEYNSFIGTSSGGVEYRYEHIYSNVLGKPMMRTLDKHYTKKDDRHNLSIFAEQKYNSYIFELSVGGLAYYNQQYDWNYYYGVDAGIFATESILFKIGADKSLRLPTFTELYYQGPSNKGNPDLIPEQAISYQIGMKLVNNRNFSFDINTFISEGENIIAWVTEKDSVMWRTENLTELITAGVESSITYEGFDNDFFINKIKASYMYLHQDKSAAGLESKYTIDHLKHNFNFQLFHSITENISGMLHLNIFERNGSFNFFNTDSMSFTGLVEYETTVLLNYSLKFEIRNFDIFLRAYNITNSDYFDIGNVPTPGFSLLGGFTYKFDF